jgi:hypothetical protein
MCEIPKCWVHCHVNRNEDDVLASSEQTDLMRRLEMILLCEVVGMKICRVDVPVDEHM